MGFYIFFVVTLNKLLNRHLSCWCFEMHWYLCDIITMEVYIYVLYNVSYYRIYLYISFNNFCNVYKSVMHITISWYHVCFCGYWMLHGWFCYDELAKIYFNNRLNVIMLFKTWHDLYGILISWWVSSMTNTFTIFTTFWNIIVIYFPLIFIKKSYFQLLSSQFFWCWNWIYWNIQVNIMATDAQAPCVSSAPFY